MFRKLFLVLFFLCTFPSIIFSSYSELIQSIKQYHGIDFTFPSNENYDVEMNAKTVTFALNNSKVVADGYSRVKYKEFNLEAERMVYAMKDNIVSFSSAVVANKDKMSLSCNHGKLILPEHVILNGDINFLYTEYSASSENAYYNFSDNTIEFQDNAIFKSEKDFLKGNSITFDLTNELVVSNGRAKVQLSTERLE
mgnify:CR=1 FL=1